MTNLFKKTIFKVFLIIMFILIIAVFMKMLFTNTRQYTNEQLDKQVSFYHQQYNDVANQYVKMIFMQYYRLSDSEFTQLYDSKREYFQKINDDLLFTVATDSKEALEYKEILFNTGNIIVPNNSIDSDMIDNELFNRKNTHFMSMFKAARLLDSACYDYHLDLERRSIVQVFFFIENTSEGYNQYCSHMPAYLKWYDDHHHSVIPPFI